MTQTETKKRGFKSRGRKKTGFPMTYLTEAQAIQIFLNLNQFTWIYKPQFALELCLPFTLAELKKRTSPLFSPAAWQMNLNLRL